MKKENIYCDYCKKMVCNEGKKLYNLNGFTAEIGYSIGGWGTRKNFINTTVEICDDCFSSVETISKELVRKILSLKNNKLKELT